MEKERRQVEIFEKEAKLLWFGQDKTILDRLDKLILPFQTAESLAIDRPPQSADLWHEIYQHKKTEWRNRLIWGDNLYVLASLLPEFRGKVDLIYIDPPFATGADFSLKVKVNGDPLEKAPSAIEMKAYSDTWSGGIASYLQWLYERLVLMRELLAETGSIYVHLDWHVGHYVKVMMDEIFGKENALNDITWKRYAAHSLSSQRYDTISDRILLYAKNASSVNLKPQLQQLSDKEIEKRFPYIEKETGRRYQHVALEQSSNRSSRGEVRVIQGKKVKTNIGWRWTQETFDERLSKNPYLIHWTKEGRPRYKVYADEYQGRPVGDVWDDIQYLSAGDSERIGFPTQKPEALLKRIILASSNPGDLVLDAFVGSGTTCAVAEKLGRRWIGIDIGRFAIHITRKRLLSIEKEDPEKGRVPCSPFVIQNLGVYERQAWLSVLSPKAKPEQTADYIRFVLEAYGARPLFSEEGIHGVKEGRAVMVGPVDRHVSWDEALKALMSAKGAGYSGLDILGWEWDHELNERFKDQAKEQGVDVRLIEIPRELIDGERDVRFAELAYVSAEATVSGRKVRVKLLGFAHPNPDWLTDEIREKLDFEDPEAWPKLVDYWACDFDYKMDTFHNGFCAYRTKKNKVLPLVSDTHEYPAPGEYTILLKVIDIFGTETTKPLKVKVK